MLNQGKMVNYTSMLIRNVAIIFIVSIFSSAFGYFIRIMLAKKLTLEEFGLFFAVYSVVLMLGWIKGFGTSSALQKFVPEFQIKNEPNNIKSVFVFVFVFSLLSSILFLCLAYVLPSGLINSYFKSNLANSLFLILFVFVSINSLSKVISSFFLSKHYSFLFSLRDLIVRASIFIMLLIIIEINIFGVSLIYIAAALLGLIINIGFFFWRFNFFCYKASITKKLIKKILKFSMPLVIKDFFGIFMSSVDNIILVFFRPLVEVAIYNAILPTADLLLLLGRPFGRIMFPLSSELWALNNKEKISSLIQKIHKYLFLLMIPVIIIIFVFSEFILNILFGADYTTGSLGLRILIMGFLFAGLNISSYSVMLGIGKSKEATKVTIFTNVINLVLNLLLIPFFGKFEMGYIGAIISTVFCSFLLFLFFCRYLKHFINYSLPIKDWSFTLVMGISLLMVGFIIKERVVIIYHQIIIFALIILIFYPLFLISFDVVSKKEIKNLLSSFI